MPKLIDIIIRFHDFTAFPELEKLLSEKAGYDAGERGEDMYLQMVDGVVVGSMFIDDLDDIRSIITNIRECKIAFTILIEVPLD